MKLNLFALISGAAVGITFGGLISSKLLHRRCTGGSFRELYADNAISCDMEGDAEICR